MYTIEGPPVESKGQPAFSPPLFGLSTARENDTYAIRIEGELDLFERPRLERALHDAEASNAVQILLDLEDLTFIDAAGLSTLVMAWRRSVTGGNRLRVTRSRGSVAAMFRLTALDTVLPFSRA
jgi:anti-sigma B factor antagonist